MIEPFLITNNLMGYVDGSIPCPSKTLSVTDGVSIPKKNPSYPIWVSNDAHVRMLIIFTISKASFRHVQGTTSRDLWLSLENAYAPHSISREYTLKTQLLRIKMHGDETPNAYLNCAQEYADALVAIGEPIKDKDLVMLVVSSLREEYNDAGANNHVTPDLEVMDNSEAHYGDDALHVGNDKGLPILHIGSSKVYSLQKTFSLKNILHVPEISHNLLYVQKKFHDNDVFFEFHTSYFVVKDESTHTTLLTGPSKHGLYTITLPQLKSMNKVSFLAVRASSTIWHRRLGHPHQRLLRSMLSNFSLPITNKSLPSFFNSCPLGKSSKLPLYESGFRSNNILDLVYYDVWGPAPMLSFEGHRYFMLCVDHHSRYMWIYHLAQIFDVYSTFKSFVQMVERQFTTKLKNVQTDWGGEFRNLASFFSSLEIIHRRSCPHTCEQNGFVERRNHHVVETGLTLLAQACVPQSQFPFDIPKTTSPPLSKTSPYYFTKSPYVIPTTYHPSPSSPRSPISSLSSVLHWSPTSQTSPESSNGQPSPVLTTSIPTPPPSTPLPPPPPSITRQRPANLHQNPKQRVSYNPFANHVIVLPTSITEPTSFVIDNNSSEWHQAMKEEYDTLMKNKMWSLVPRASNTNVVDGIDFHKTFSAVIKSTTIRAVLSLAVTNSWPLHQLDVNNAFLYGYLKEQVYMKQPSGFIDPQRPNHVCLLHRSLYGLKQAPRAWFERFSKALFDLDFKSSKTNPSLFIYSRGHKLLYILVYVDDIIITSNNKGTIDNIISQLGSAFALKDLRPLNYFLGIEIVPHVSGILLSQKKYILELLQMKYRQVVGSLQYVTLSRPDIAFAVNKICQYMHASTENHWSAVNGFYIIFMVRLNMGIQTINGPRGDSLYILVQTLYLRLLVNNLQALLHELGIRSSSTPILWCDNLCATYLSANPIFHSSGLIYCSGGLSGKYIVLAVCQIVHWASGLSFLTAVHLIRQRFLSSDIQCAGFDTRPPMLDRTDFASWKQCIRLYCYRKENGVNILKSIDEGPFQMGTFRETLVEGEEDAFHLGPERPRVYSDLSSEEKKRYKADIWATNILLQGLPKDIYTLVNHYTYVKDIWDNVKMLLEGSELTKEDQDSQPYDDFEHFRQNKEETIHDYYVWYAKLITDVQNIKMTMSKLQLNSKFVNNMLPEWGRFVTAVKLNRGLRDSNYDQLYTYLKQNEAHANENKMMNQATVQDDRVVVQTVQGRQNRGLGNNARRTGAAGYGGAQNRVALDEEQLLFIGGGQDNVEDDDVDEQPAQDWALNVDNVFQANDCDAFDCDIDEVPTTQTMFMANLSSTYPVYDKVGPSYDSDILSEVHDHDNYQDDVCKLHDVHEMHDSTTQCASVKTHSKVVDASLTAELAIYKEQVELYERRANFELTEHEQKIEEQLRIVIIDRNIKKKNLKKELHSVKMQLNSTINHNKSMVEEVTSLKKDFKQKENKYLEEFLDMKALKEKVEDRLFKQDQSLQTVHMLCKPKPHYDEQRKVAIGYKNPFYLSKAKQVKPALYSGQEIVKPNYACVLVHDSEDTLEIAETTRKQMNEKMKDPACVKKKVKIAPHDYSKENYLATFTPQKQLIPEQIFWPMISSR
nr:retrotransposon protein, putative, Ty1-copia subclass [Tanacetum cinerariifolium]